MQIEAKEIEVPKMIIKKWQKVVNIMASLLDVPAALIMKLEAPYIKVLLASENQDNPYLAGDKEKMDGLYCEYVIKTGEKLEVINALKDPQWQNNPDLDLAMIAYHGRPLYWPDGQIFGTICILDKKENEFSEKVERLVLTFKELIEANLEIIYTDQKMKKLKNKYSTTLYSIGDGVITTDLQGKITMMNAAAEDMTGWEFEQAAGKKLTNVFQIESSEDGSVLENPVHKVLQAGKVVGLANDTTLIAKDGSSLQIADTAAPIKADDGEMRGVILVFSDVTKEYKYKEELLNSRNLINSTLDSLSDHICVLDLNAQITHVNQAWYEFLQENNIELEKLTEGANLIDNFSLIIAEKAEKYQKLTKALKAVISGERKKFSLEFSLGLSEKKNYYFCRITSLCDFNSDFKSCGAVISIENITERKLAEIKVIREKEWLNSIFESGVDSMVKVDNKHRIIDINDRFREVFKYELEEIKGLNLDQVMDQGKANTADRELTCNFLEGKEVQSESTRYDKYGNPRECLVRGIPVIAEGKFLGGFAIYIDITERKEKERKITHMSFHDGLTGLYNRLYLEEAFERYNTGRQLPISLIMFDLNGLKIINDSYGHKIGDQMLIKAAEVFKESFRQEDIISRWGGDEFVILLPQTTQEEAEQIYQRFKEVEIEVQVAEKEYIPVSIAGGISTKYKVDNNIYNVLQRAEDKMYKNKLLKKQSGQNKMLKTMLATLEEKSQENDCHAKRLEELALLLGQDLDLSVDEQNRLSLLATLHDIGKITVPEKILRKPGELSPEEWEVMKKHPGTGFRLCSAIDDFSHIAYEVFSHHEHWDGSGYPRAIKGKEIPLLARVIAIVDSYDVMRNGRPYKRALSKEEALEEIQKNAGTQFDPELALKFVAMMKEKPLLN